VPKIDIATAPADHGTSYPDEHAGPCLDPCRRRLGDAVGLSQFGVNMLRLPLGAWSSQRDWHASEDEFVWVLSGEVVLRAGDCAGFKAGVANGHKLDNRSDGEAVLLEVGTRSPTTDACDYPDIDMVLPQDADRYFHRD